MNVTAYTDNSLFGALQPHWNDLVQRSAASTPFNTWEWNSAWWAAYHPGTLWVLTCQDDTGTVQGIAPFFIEQDANLGRVLRLIGHIDVTDYMDIIAAHDRQDDVFRCFAQYLAQHTTEFDALGLSNLRDTGPTYTQFPDKLREQGLVVDFEQVEVAPQIPLPKDYEVYLNDRVNSKERKEIKRKMRKAEAGEYAVAWYIVDETHDLQAELDRFVALMASAEAKKAEFLENTQHRDFFNRLVPLAQQAGWLQLMFITIDGEACAAYFNFDYGNRIYVYNSGLAPEKFGALAPGIVLLQYAIQHAIKTGRDAFDFMRGNEEYKYRMGGEDKPLYQLNARNPQT